MHSCLFLSNLYQFSTWFLLQYLTISTTSQYNQKKKKIIDDQAQDETKGPSPLRMTCEAWTSSLTGWPSCRSSWPYTTRHDTIRQCIALIEMKRRVTHSSALSPSFTVPSEFLSYSLLPLPLGLPAHRNPMLLAALSAEFICFVLTYTAWLKPPSLLHTQRIDRDREEEEKVKISNRYSDLDC